ncbi:MAG: S-layer homology domain-containing protein [Candidatus Ornithomonoglobus sp.]
MKFNKYIAMLCAAVLAANAGVYTAFADEADFENTEENIEEVIEAENDSDAADAADDEGINDTDEEENQDASDEDTDQENIDADETGNAVKETEEPGAQNVPEEITRPYFTAVTDYEKCPFVDCVADWYMEPVSFAYANGMIKGHDDTHFDPNGNVTRDQLAVILYRIEAGDSAETEGDNWADAAEEWVIEAGIMSDFIDIDTEAFDGSELLTREQVISTIFRAYQLHNIAEERDELERFIDVSKVSENQLDAIRWSVAVGVLAGNAVGNGKYWVAPHDKVTRAETVTFIYRYLTNLTFADITVTVDTAEQEEVIEESEETIEETTAADEAGDETITEAETDEETDTAEATESEPVDEANTDITEGEE